jgi:lipoprotein-releasing system permease protein
VVQGAVIGLGGILIGALIGVPAAINAGNIVAFFESVLNARVFDPQVYFISRIPSILVPGDVVLVCLLAWGLSVLAALYPAWRAAQIEPAEALRYE